MKRFLIQLVCLCMAYWANAYEPVFSTAGFFRLPDTGREVFSMNPAWRFYKGGMEGAEACGFDDRSWQVVSLPNGIEYLPTESSGCINYQGEVWYRKHFTPAETLKGKKLFLHFEAIMGKSKIYVNGRLLAEHYGGYLPVSVDMTQVVKWGEDNVIAVWADNRDDATYAPGKPQDVLDYTYFGGIYRDCWLIAHNQVFITDPNYENQKAGGGLLVAFDQVSDTSADILLQTHVRNDGVRSFSGRVVYTLVDSVGREVATTQSKLSVGRGTAVTCRGKMKVKQPQLWTPAAPYLYKLKVLIHDADGRVVDGYYRRVGIRSIEFKGKDGFWLNGKPYGKPLIGANRHQDYAVVGNAVANSIHWRDAKKLKDLGLEVIRNAHCPQDPAFMDACDELGLFVIVNTPGWQFWNEAPIFAERVYSDIRQMVRRDRNHPCVWLWEPILNETWYPADFAGRAKEIVEEEFPYGSSYSGCDTRARGAQYFPVQFNHPMEVSKRRPDITYFTREWGDNVDDWNSHNSPSRVARNWGEQPMLIQAAHYASPYYDYTCYDGLYKESPWHVGGCLWHSFDHQRGYHPDPFYGGLADVFRQPKYAYYMFMAQRSPEAVHPLADSGPMVYIAHEMTPFSSRDVTVYSNCEEVRLTVNKGGKVYTYRKDKDRVGMPSPIITFTDAFDFMEDKKLSGKKRTDEVFLLAEGLMDGKVVAAHKVCPARRPAQIRLRVDHEGMKLRADGSDFVTVVAEVTDKNGNVKHLNNYFIQFSVEGEGRILGDTRILANPAPVKWGAAPVLIQSTTVPGKIKIRARVLYDGSQMPLSGELELTTVSPMYPLLFHPAEEALMKGQASQPETERRSSATLEQERSSKVANEQKLKEVERQQTDFGETRN